MRSSKLTFYLLAAALAALPLGGALWSRARPVVTAAILLRALSERSASPLTSGVFEDSGQALGQDANAVALGDLDLDGDLDVFLANPAADTVWLNDGQGVFTDSGQSLATQYGLAVALGDLDSDGDLDAFTVEDDATGILIFMNQGGLQGGALGVFAANGQTVGDDLSSHVALGDVDGDFDLDAFVVRNIGRADKVWLNNGLGQFSDSGQSLGARSGNGVALGDLDGDGDLDAFVADDSQNTVYVNQGGAQGGAQGTFVDSGQALPDALSAGAALGDMDRDGDLDAVTAGVNSDLNGDLWINQGGDQGGAAGTFLDGGQDLGFNNRHVTLSDVDVDGDLDLFIARNGPNSLWLNQGGVQGGTAGDFLDTGQSMDNLFSPSAALGDLDADNDPDAVVANLGPTQV